MHHQLLSLHSLGKIPILVKLHFNLVYICSCTAEHGYRNTTWWLCSKLMTRNLKWALNSCLPEKLKFPCPFTPSYSSRQPLNTFSSVLNPPTTLLLTSFLAGDSASYFTEKSSATSSQYSINLRISPLYLYSTFLRVTINRGSAHFLYKCKWVSILGFVGHTVSITTTHCCYTTKAAIHYVKEWAGCVPIKLYLLKTQQIRFNPWTIVLRPLINATARLMSFLYILYLFSAMLSP